MAQANKLESSDVLKTGKHQASKEVQFGVSRLTILEDLVLMKKDGKDMGNIDKIGTEIVSNIVNSNGCAVDTITEIERADLMFDVDTEIKTFMPLVQNGQAEPLLLDGGNENVWSQYIKGFLVLPASILLQKQKVLLENTGGISPSLPCAGDRNRPGDEIKSHENIEALRPESKAITPKCKFWGEF